MPIPFLLLPWLKSKIFGNPLSMIFIGFLVLVLAIIVIPNLDQIRERFGFETRTTLKMAAEKERTNTNTALEANKQLDKALELTKEISNDNIEAIKKVEISKDTSDTKVAVIKEKKKAKIKAVVSTPKPKDKPTTPNTGELPPSVEDIQISQIQIDSVWDTYCQFNDNASCKG